MTISEMFGQSGVLCLLGMGGVFSFLIIMIISVTVMGKIVHALGADKAPAAASVAAAGSVFTAASGFDAGTVAAIGAAVSQYRKERA